MKLQKIPVVVVLICFLGASPIAQAQKAKPIPLRFKVSSDLTPSARVDKPYSYNFCSPKKSSTSNACGGLKVKTTNPAGGRPPYRFEFDLTNSFLTLESGGLLKGTPAKAGKTAFNLCVVDSTGKKICKKTSLTVKEAPYERQPPQTPGAPSPPQPPPPPPAPPPAGAVEPTGQSTSYEGTWTYAELLNSKAPAEPGRRCPCGVPGNSEIASDDPHNCGPIKYTSPAIVDSRGKVTIFGNSTWGTIDSRGRWQGLPQEEGYANGTVSGICTSSTSCRGTFKADYITDAGGVAACYDGTFTMTKN